MLSCGGSSNSPSPVLNLSGTWVGMVGQPMSGSALRLTWTATHNGAVVAGPATMVKPSVNVPATGTMTGVVSGDQMTLTYTVPAGGVPVYLSCTINGAGSATVASQSITGTLNLTFTNCLGSGLEATDSPQLSLLRQ